MARKIPIQCASCLSRMRVNARLIGQKRSCPVCGKTLIVESISAADKKAAVPAGGHRSNPVLISQSETIDQRLEWGEVASNEKSILEELDGEGVRVRNLVAEFVKAVGQPQGRTAS